MIRPRYERSAFTLIELLVVIAIIGTLISILLPALGQARKTARQLKCSTNIRSMIQGLILFGQNNADAYPLPSVLDKDHATVPASGGLGPGEPDPEKDNSGNIYSVMIFQGFFPPELLRTPSETNFDIEVDLAYEYYQPQRATNPAAALWDPGFAGTPMESGSGGGNVRRSPYGHVSYAHLTPFGARRSAWHSTYATNEAVIANRGPIWGGSPGAWAPVPGPFGLGSNTMRIHGADQRWEGNVGYNDGRVAQETRPDPLSLHWAFTALPPDRRNSHDNLFVNENDATGVVEPDSRPALNRNAFLKLYRNVQAASGEPTISVWQD